MSKPAKQVSFNKSNRSLIKKLSLDAQKFSSKLEQTSLKNPVSPEMVICMNKVRRDNLESLSVAKHEERKLLKTERKARATVKLVPSLKSSITNIDTMRCYSGNFSKENLKSAR